MLVVPERSSNENYRITNIPDERERQTNHLISYLLPLIATLSDKISGNLEPNHSLSQFSALFSLTPRSHPNCVLADWSVNDKSNPE